MSERIDTPLISIPRLGYGTWRLSGAEGQAAVESALSLGYRALDTAEMYGNEAEVGAGLKASGLPRGEVFVTSKVWWTHLGPEEIRAHCEASLERLGTDYLDLYLIHWPAAGMDLPRVMGDMARLRKEGLARAIGVANFPPGLLKRAIETGVPIATNQVEYHALLSQDRLLEITRPNGIVLTAYSPLGQGRLASDPKLLAIAERHGVSAAQVALAWLLRQDGVAVIPKAARPESQRSNLEALSLAQRLTEADIAEIDALPKDQRFVKPDFAPDWSA
ncbi:aldo/keto reductase [Muricoccus pecuniae]|uniref:2,5-diketo-D-gluconate reductase B n=1 Tax=Muricoccus pecuniae TaxID=693023 RepID=A0A840XY82_9PROT|nr:aldo/keto reductase [Roseomonas pecuniae]MBB5692200.1 2,5-diketo-D-gluconate reductase B [Roseomonas pecuniae]